MKRIKIGKKARLITAVLLVLLLAISAAGLLWFYKKPMEAAEEITVFSYRQQAKVEYAINYHANEFISEIPQVPQIAYINQLTDSIDTDFSYRLSGQREMSAQGEYSVEAFLTAYTGTEKSIVWEKHFTLLQPTDFTASDKELVLEEKISVPFSQYTDFANKVAEGIGFSPDDLELTVKYNVSVIAETDSGAIMEEAAPTMIIPMRGRVYTVGGSPMVEKEGGITKTQMVPVPLLREIRLGCSVAAVISAVLLILLLVFTVPVGGELSQAEIEVRRILKKHADRIAICQSCAQSLLSGKTVEVRTIEDLVKVSDELGKPIFYSENQQQEQQAFIIIADDTYVYNVKPHAEALTAKKAKGRLFTHTIVSKKERGHTAID